MNTECPHLISVSLHLDGELNDSERASLLEHLQSCSDCSRELEDLTRLRSLLGAVSVPPAARERVSRALPALRNHAFARNRRIPVPLPLAAGVLLALFISVCANAYLGMRRAAPAPTPDPSKTVVRISKPTAPAALSAPTPATADRSRPAADKSGETTAGRTLKTTKPSPSSATRKPAMETSVVTVESDEGTIEVVTGGIYQWNKSPKIYAGSYFDPLEKR